MKSGGAGSHLSAYDSVSWGLRGSAKYNMMCDIHFYQNVKRCL